MSGQNPSSVLLLRVLELILRQSFCDLMQILLQAAKFIWPYSNERKSSDGIFIAVGFEIITHSDFKNHIQTMNAGFIDRCPHFRNTIFNFTF